MNCGDISVMHEERERKGGARVLVFCGVERETQGCSLSVTGRRCAEGRRPFCRAKRPLTKLLKISGTLFG